MKVSGPTTVLGFVLLAALAPGAEGGAPLESTKQELRRLESGQKTNAAPGATDDLRGNLPVIHTLSQDPPSIPPMTNPEKMEKDRLREKEARKNWLVNGVEKLERESKDKATHVLPGDETLPDAEEKTPLESTDPQYLLKLYDEQKKTEQARLNETRAQRPPQSDPLAPFLQGWLGNSPVRGQFFDEFVRKPDGAGVSGASPGGYQPLATPREGAATTGLSAGQTQSAERPPNPYLVDAPPTGMGGPLQGVTGAPSAAPSLPVGGPVISQPILPAAVPPPELRSPERKPPPPPLADDKKYFPQLKRF